MKNGIFLACSAAVLLACAASKSSAGITYTMNFSGASGGLIANLAGIDKADFEGTSILGFRDNGDGVISAGDTFQDYGVSRFTVFTDTDGNGITPGDYGTGGPPRTHEVTVRFAFSGLQLDSNNYIVTGVQLFEMTFDFGAGFSQSTFNNLATFVNSPIGIVEHAILGGPSSGTNANATSPNGSLTLQLQIIDDLANGDFELYNPPIDPLNIVVTGLVDANNFATPPATPILGRLNAGIYDSDGLPLTLGTTTIAAGGGFSDIFASFGLSGTQDFSTNLISDLEDNNGEFDFAFQTRSTGSFIKGFAAVPEPGSMLIWCGMGLVGAVTAARRRKLAA